VLTERGWLERKGAAHTFDVSGFVHTLQRVRAGAEDIYVPVFDRNRDIAIAGAGFVAREIEIVLVEGNYLFLNAPGWNTLKALFDTKLFLSPDLSVIEQRLLQRWRDAGLDEGTVNQRTYQNDLPNAESILNQSNLDGVQVVSEV